MLIVHLRGGLGNQMFQYALYQAAVESGKKASLDLSHFNKNNQSTQYELGDWSRHARAALHASSCSHLHFFK